jgi:hypothetical protein
MTIATHMCVCFWNKSLLWRLALQVAPAIHQAHRSVGLVSSEHIILIGIVVNGGLPIAI